MIFTTDLHPVIEARILWDLPINKGDWVFSSYNRVTGIVRKFFTYKGQKVAELVFIRQRTSGPNFIRKFVVPFSSLLRVRTPEDYVIGPSLIWKKLKYPPSLTCLDSQLMGKKKLQKYYWCTEVQYFLGGKDVCMRRRDNPHNLWPGCEGCDLSPLLGRSPEDKKELERIREEVSLMVFRDPPPHPVKGQYEPADRWKSGDKIIGKKDKPNTVTKIGTVIAPSMFLQKKTKKRKKQKNKREKQIQEIIKPLISRKKVVTTASLITEEAKRLTKQQVTKRVVKKRRKVKKDEVVASKPKRRIPKRRIIRKTASKKIEQAPTPVKKRRVVKFKKRS